ncbi:VENN motif pre-toxin domain-containing protein [Escherichia coli]|nr:VENN motif pre-toxin domain-containing protein [Escherichia coli]MBN6454399.1 VENN motif pre-toxin domain-containing protein [Escherichia coli]
MADLNRDAAHANQTLSPIFDREKEQQRLQQAQLIGEIGNQVADIARTEGQIAGEKAKRDPAALNQARAELEAAGKPFTEQDVAQRAYNNGMAASGFGTGGKYQQAIQAATAAVQGLAGGNLSAALAGGAAPYLAEVVKTMTTDPVTGEVNKAANVAAHAVVNAALAVAQGNNALAGAAGAATGEVVGMIATQMYGKPVSELSEAEKQTVSTLATVAAGLAGGLVGDSGASAVAGAQSGKTTVENNLLGGSEWLQTEKAREHGADVLSCSDNPSGEACKRGQAENKAYAAALATSSVSLLPRSAQAMWALGAGANAGIGSMVDSSVDPENAIIAGWVNVITMGQGWKGTVGWNAAGGAFGNWLDGKDPLSGAAMSGGTSAIGYGVGKVVQGPLEKVINPNWKNWEWLNVGMGISKPLPLNPTPGIAGNIGSSIGSEGSGAIIQEQLKNQQEKK